MLLSIYSPLYLILVCLILVTEVPNISRSPGCVAICEFKISSWVEEVDDLLKNWLFKSDNSCLFLGSSDELFIAVVNSSSAVISTVMIAWKETSSSAEFTLIFCKVPPVLDREPYSNAISVGENVSLFISKPLFNFLTTILFILAVVNALLVWYCFILNTSPKEPGLSVLPKKNCSRLSSFCLVLSIILLSLSIVWRLLGIILGTFSLNSIFTLLKKASDCNLLFTALIAKVIPPINIVLFITLTPPLGWVCS